MKTTLLLALLGIVVCVAGALPALAAPTPLFVSPHGRDTWSGTLAEPNASKTDGPFATLERARDAVRAARAANKTSTSVRVRIRGGVYPRKETFVLDERDGGASPGAPVFYEAFPGEAVRLVGGRAVSGWKPVTDPKVLARLDPAARGAVRQADLRAQNITDFGALTRRGFGAFGKPAALELFFNDQPMTLARWPNAGEWATIAEVPAPPGGGDSDRFTYAGDRPQRWTQADDVWLHGYWKHDWAESYEKIAAINSDQHEIVTVAPHGVYGYTKGKRFYALNLLEELDQPGEWFLDRKTGILYFWPPSPVEKGRVVVSILEQPLVSLTDASHLFLRGLTLEAARGDGIRVSGGSGVHIENCVVRNLGDTGIVVSGGTNHHVDGCEITQVGEGGIVLEGGDRKTLAPGGHVAENNRIHDFSRWVKTYRPGIAISGVGNHIAHNAIYNAPHSAILLSGNDHIVEFNEIHHVCQETEDAGAFYMGRDWTMRGNVVRYNDFHDLRVASGLKGDFSVMAVYLDDCASGTTVLGNRFVRAGRAVMIGGGHDNVVANNVFVDCPVAVWVDARARGWAKAHAEPDTGDWHMRDKLDAVGYDQPPYRTRYPALATILDDYADPTGTRIVHNIAFNVGKWLDLHDKLTPESPELTIANNWTDGAPGFVAPDKGDYRLKPNAPALRTGFEPLPKEKTGPVR